MRRFRTCPTCARSSRNAMLAEQAADAGAGLIDWHTATIGHDSCQLPVIRWVEPVGPAIAGRAALRAQRP